MNAHVVSQPPLPIVIRRATVGDAAALAEFGARTFFETFAADNTAEDMRLHLASAWAPGHCSAPKSSTRRSTPCSPASMTAAWRDSRSCAPATRRPES